MALPSVSDVKLYLRIETTAEDSLIALLLTGVTQGIERYLGRPITAGRTFVESAVTTAGAWPVVRSFRGPADAVGAVAETVRATTTATALEDHPDYEDGIEGTIGLAMLLWVADLYQNRNPRATSEGSAGGSSTSLMTDAIPPKIAALLAPFVWRE